VFLRLTIFCSKQPILIPETFLETKRHFCKSLLIAPIILYFIVACSKNYYKMPTTKQFGAGIFPTKLKQSILLGAKLSTLGQEDASTSLLY
jgi:hypothetical protein